ncbi:DUF4390 domain-containing protein [Zoogloea sp.]|uniref:DUF4390 domain-containing protein n=1 Tax=Zoogloea sp. TaxID=49181 RepID=UPI0035AFFAF8
MTDFSTPCSRKLPERRRFLRTLAALMVGGLLNASAPAYAAEAEIRAASIDVSEDQYVLNADISADLTPLLADVVGRGVSLFFVTEFELRSPRWYWFDEEVVSKTVTYRLSYQSLTRQYRLTTGTLHQNFSTVEEAMRTMLRIRNWGVSERSGLRPGRSYNAALRFRLDVAELPKPLQVSAFGRKDWNLGTDWYRWTFVAGRESK